MQYTKGLIKSVWEDIKKDTWYRQRFDACPHFMFFLGDAHTSTIQETKYPFGQRTAYAGFSKNRADWYHSVDALNETTQSILAELEKNKNLGQKMVEDFSHFQEAFYKECVQLEKRNLTLLNDQQLLDVYANLAEIYTKNLNSSPLIDGFALATDTLIAEKIKKHLVSQNREEEFGKVFPLLTAPVFLSFLQEEEITLLEMAKKIKENPEFKNSLLTEHQQKYFWIQNNYVKDYSMPVEVFEQRVNAFLGMDIDACVEERKQLPVQYKEEKQDLFKEYNFPDEIVNLINFTDIFTEWQDERKKGTFYATHYFSLLLEEFSKRTGIELDLLKYAFPPEMKEVLKGNLSKEILEKRFEYCIIFWQRSGKYDVTLMTSEIEELDAIGTGEIKHTDELKGFVASRGIVTGKVKVLESADEITKIEAGDILVAVMTRPDYLPAMQKAAGFVTDEGGITCHAAIVAREMKKPCVIGTKIATKVLKDGDLVEVDADNGIVRKIPK